MNLAAGLLAVIIVVVPAPPGPDRSAPAPAPAAAPEAAAPPGSVTPGSAAAAGASVGAVVLRTGGGRTVQVGDPVSLDAALASAQPGQTIVLADGTYQGRFTIARPGQQGNPITLRGSRNAVINGGDLSGGYDLHLDGANFWQLVGFSVTGGQKGIMTDRTNNTVLSGLDVGNTGQEGVHIGDFSSNNVLQNSVVHDTGKAQPAFGEGLYLGTAKSNWTKRSGGRPDRSDNNRAINNTFRNTTSENVDIKEETSGGLIAGNAFDGTGISGANFADSVLDVKGTGYRILDNVTSGTSPHLKNGFQTHVITDPATSGCGNTFANNVFVPPTPTDITLDPACARR